MFKILRMVCAIIAAACAVACIIVAVNWGMIPFWCFLAGGVLFFALCLLFKYLQEEKEGTAEGSALSERGKGESAGKSDDKDADEDENGDNK